MFRYYLKLAGLSIRRNLALNGLMMAAIATGIAACMTMMNIAYVMGGNPIPHKSENLYYVQLDSWDPLEPFEGDRPPNQVTYRDGLALLAAKMARQQVLSYLTSRAVQPDDRSMLPFLVNSRSTTRDFFTTFDTPFLFGGGWDRAADDNREFVAVISKETNDRLFGGEDSVGENIVMNDDNYQVTGVMDTWNPLPRFYDVVGQAFTEPEAVYIPLSTSIQLELFSEAGIDCWKPIDGDGFQSFLNSECVWMQFWVELHGEDEKEQYQTFLDAYVESQKSLGRFPRPLNNRLSNVMEWLRIEKVVDSDVKVLLGLAFLFLVVCLLNTTGLLIAKILRRTGDISIRRALGASRRTVFAQYVVEAGMIGISGGLLGIGMTWLGLLGIKSLYVVRNFPEHLIYMDWVMICAAVALALVASLSAALIPTWRACSVQPTSHLVAG